MYIFTTNWKSSPRLRYFIIRLLVMWNIIIVVFTGHIIAMPAMSVPAFALVGYPMSPVRNGLCTSLPARHDDGVIIRRGFSQRYQPTIMECKSCHSPRLHASWLRMTTAGSFTGDENKDRDHRNNQRSNGSMKPRDDKTKRKYEWNKKNFAIAGPALVGMLIDPLLSLMDTAYVGRVGSMELAALGSCTSIFHLAFNAFRATTSSTTALVAGKLPADEEGAKEVTAKSLQLGIGIGILVSLALYGGGTFALSQMGVAKGTSELYPAAASYLFARSWAAPAVLVCMVSEGAFRGFGNTLIPLTASCAAALINLILDPVLMFQPINMGVRGAAIATALAQVGAAGVYVYHLFRRRMLPAVSRPNIVESSTKANGTKGVIRTILEANLAMLAKQGSLLLAWAYATARATRLGAVHVAAHQIAVSVWLVFALILDAPAVSSQVLMSRVFAAADKPAFSSLMRYMVTFATVQGLCSMLLVDCLDFLPGLFTPDKQIHEVLHAVVQPLAFHQLLVSLTLVLESLAVGCGQFRTLAVGTALSTMIAMRQISVQTTVAGIWSYGINALFAGRLLTASFACLRGRHVLSKGYNRQSRDELKNH